MKIDEFVAVSGMSGLYKMVANRSNGLIVESLDNGKRIFAPARKHQFTPLASIGIYTDDDTAELKVVFRAMLEQLESNPPLPLSSSTDELVEYFGTVLPEFDRDRVYVSDIKKVIKWFNFLNERELLDLAELRDETAEAAEAAASEVVEDGPAEESTEAAGDAAE